MLVYALHHIAQRQHHSDRAADGHRARCGQLLHGPPARQVRPAKAGFTCSAACTGTEHHRRQLQAPRRGN